MRIGGERKLKGKEDRTKNTQEGRMERRKDEEKKMSGKKREIRRRRGNMIRIRKEGIQSLRGWIL